MHKAIHLRRAVAAIMAVWMSGVLFLICCHVQSTEAADFCPLAKLGAHCEKAEREKNSDKLTNQNDEQGIDCCGFIPLAFDKTRTFELDKQVVFAPAAQPKIEQHRDVVQTVTASARLFPGTLLVKNDTFLKNRTFRI